MDAKPRRAHERDGVQLGTAAEVTREDEQHPHRLLFETAQR
jgi:hypothetical protein